MFIYEQNTSLSNSNSSLCCNKVFGGHRMSSKPSIHLFHLKCICSWATCSGANEKKKVKTKPDQRRTKMKNLKENKNEKSEKKHLIDFHKEQHNSLYCLLNRHQTKQRQKKATQKNEHNKQTESSELMGAIELMSGALKILK